jgi:hypothetical protein
LTAIAARIRSLRKPHSSKRGTAKLTLAALGVVYGDIGTSPLYALKEVFGGAHHPVPIDEANVLGILSLSSGADARRLDQVHRVHHARPQQGRRRNHGADGLVLRSEKNPARARLLMLLGLFGAALFYGDGLITPAISVLSAVEGLEVATPALKPYVIPLSLLVLAALFAFQKRGTGGVGALFGPIMIVWFVTIAALGLAGIVRAHAGARRCQSRLRPGIPRIARRAGISFARGGRARGDRCRSALRRHGALRQRPRAHRLEHARLSLAGSQLFRPGRVAHRRPEDRRESVLSTGARGGHSTLSLRLRQWRRSSRRRR